MMNINYSKAQRLASDIRTARLSIDTALSDMTLMTHSMLDVCRESDIPAAKSQEAIEEITGGLVKIVSARKGFVAAHKQISIVQRASNLQPINFGCEGAPLMQNNLHVVSG